MSKADPTDAFLARWARRKQQAQATPTGQPPPPDGDAAPPPDAVADEPPVDLATLPKLEDLTAESDITNFLRKGVPEELKRLALRRVWSLDPAIRDFIEVAENQYDWNLPGGVPGFGELAPGTDHAALLAQALGLQPAHVVAEPDAGAVAAVHQPEATPALSEQDSAEVGQPHPSAPTTSSTEPPPSLPVRRRHGGALPA